VQARSPASAYGGCVTPMRHVAGTACHVLRDDVSLAEAIPAADRERAIEECIAPAARIPVGRWSGLQADVMPGGIGLLVLQGLLTRHVRAGGRVGAELLGKGDLMRPWQAQGAPAALSYTTRWRVLEPVVVAMLDGGVARRFARYPELTGQLVARTLERSRTLAINLAIVQQPRVNVRVHLLLWHLADRWGYQRSEGTALPLRLTHDVLADLVAARRPTVSTALSQLTKAELVRPDRHGWLLLGARPPAPFERQRLPGVGAPSIPPAMSS
jgi:CRP/FNR family transcriptional regulator, cyclic AMP receptor protein